MDNWNEAREWVRERGWDHQNVLSTQNILRTVAVAEQSVDLCGFYFYLSYFIR